MLMTSRTMTIAGSSNAKSFPCGLNGKISVEWYIFLNIWYVNALCPPSPSPSVHLSITQAAAHITIKWNVFSRATPTVYLHYQILYWLLLFNRFQKEKVFHRSKALSKLSSIHFSLNRFLTLIVFASYITEAIKSRL